MTEKIKKFLQGMKKKKPKFLRKDSCSISRLGKSRRKKQKWRKPKGRHSKLRAKKRSVGFLPGTGYRAPKLLRGTIAGLKPVLIRNEKELAKLHEGDIAILSNVGLKKKIQIAKKASAMNLKFLNFDASKFLSEVQKKIDEKKNFKQSSKEKAGEK